MKKKNGRWMLLAGAAVIMAAAVAFAGCGKSDKSVKIENSQKETAEEKTVVQENEGAEEERDTETEKTTKNAVLELPQDGKRFPVGNRKTMTRIAVVKNGEKVFEISKEASENQVDFSEWQVTAPYHTKQLVNVSDIYTFLDNYAAWGYLEKAEEERFIDSGDWVEEEFSDTGSVKIQIGEEDEEGNSYVRADYSGNVYKVDKEMLEVLTGVEPYDFIMGIANLVYLTTIDTLEIDTGDTKAVFEIKTDSSNDQEFMKEGKKADKDQFTKLYSSLISVLITKEADREQAEKVLNSEKPVLSLKYKRNQEGLIDIEIAYYPYDDENYLLSRDKKAEFLVSREQVNQIINQAEIICR